VRTDVQQDSRKPWYFITTLLIFWIPLLPLSRRSWTHLRPPEKKAFWASCALVGFLTFCMEFVYRRVAKIWTFSQEKDRLVGLRIFGEPIEEFSFWIGATPFMLLLYLCHDKRRTVHHAK
jgi:hypothetical protein